MNSTNTAFLDDKLTKEKEYWLGKLSGELGATALPLDRKRPAAFGGRGASLNFRFDGETESRLRALCGGKEALMFAALVAALKVCLHKYTGNEEVVVGTAIHERHAEVSSINKVLALRDSVRPKMRVKELLQAVKGTLSEAYANQKYPFERLVGLLNMEEPGNRAPLVNVVAILDTPANRENVGGLMNDVTLAFSLEGGAECRVEYNPDLFVPETVELFAQHFRTALRAMLDNPDAEVSCVELLSSERRRELLFGFNETRAEYPGQLTVMQLFETQAERTPAAAAVTFEGQELTYRELNESANRLARLLRERGLGPGQLAAIFLDHSADTVVALLAVLKAGAGYLPLDINHPAARLGSVLEDARAALLLTTRRLLERLPAEAHGSAVCLEEKWDEAAGLSAENLPHFATPDDTAYVIYTSGSTGTPKGVVIRHRSLVNYICWAARVYLKGDALDFPLYSSLAFDLTVTSIYTPLVTGNRVAVYRTRGKESVLERILSDGAAGVLKLTPSHLATLRGQDWRASGVRRLIVGGEALESNLAREMTECFGEGLEIYNEYGPTEATVGCMIHRFDPARDARASVPIGVPAANTRIYILDGELEPVAEGMTGELYIGGDGLAAGYLNREELTSERFIENPFCPGEKMYRTGDVARWLPGGVIEYVGRRDEQVKIRGFRVELGEISGALNKHTQVGSSVVLVTKDAAGHDVLIAYYVAGQEIDPSQLHDFLSESIIEETIPNLFVHLSSLPLTVNGKVDVGALPTLEAAREKLKRAFVAPRNAVEEILCAAWCQMLGLQKAGVNDNFFTLGGHSLLATQLVSRVREVFKVELPLRAVFESPTVAELARRIESAAGEDNVAAAPPLRPAPRAGHLPLSFAQQRLWFINQLAPDSHFYNVTAAVRLKGRLDVSALEQTLTEVVRRHEILRTTFTMADGQPAQVVSEPQPLALTTADLSGSAPDEREEELQRQVTEFSRRPFDLARGPLLRVKLVRLGEEEHAVLLVTHHIVGDGWSMNVLTREVSAIYNAFSQGKPSPLSELPIQYADYAVWQRGWLQGETLESHLAYWREQLAGAPPVLELPTDKPRPAVQTYRGASHTFQLPREAYEGLKELSRREGATLYMTLLAAFQLLLSRYTGQKDIVVGTPIAGRNRAETEGLIGFFVNTLVMRADLSGDPTFREALRSTRETALEAYAHEDLPFEKIVEELNPERSLSHAPLVQAVFGFQNLQEQSSEVSDLSVSALGSESGTARFDVVQNIFETQHGLVGTLHCNTDIFEEETIRRMAGHFLRLLEAAAADPDRPVSRLPLFDAAERQRLLTDSNLGAPKLPAACVHNLFEEQARLSPDATALVFEGERLSYAELDRRSSRLARHLRVLGVGPESLVAVLLERSAEMVVSLLAVLKAGGAYVPLDPAYPQERLRFMLEDSGAGVLITQEAVLAQESLAGIISDISTEVVRIDADSEVISSYEDSAPPSPVTPDNLAYVIYTSGSTGRPKGSLVTHRNVSRLLKSAAPHFEFGPADVWTLFHSYAFDFSVWEIWGALCTGGSVVVVPYWVSRSPREFLRLLTARGVTVLNQTPAAFRQLSAAVLGTDDAEGVADSDADGIPSLRYVIFGGEALDPSTLSGWFARFGDRSPRLVNMYGITETTVHVTLRPMTAADASGHMAPIGPPLDDLELYVLDPRMEPVPEGVAGELYVGGDGLARGYLGRASLTAERFMPHPFGAGRGERLYRTGDVARRAAGGELYYVGRCDEQVKVRGFRIELGEIEAALQSHEGVRECVVLAREMEGGDKRLVAYVVADGADVELGGAELRAHLKGRLPEYMVPSAFVALDAMPLTANGKVDRRALPEPEAQARHEGEQSAAPETPLQRWLAGHWQAVLNVPNVGLGDNFFDLGGDSIKAAVLTNRLQDELGEVVHVVTVFDCPTPGSYAGYLEGRYPDAAARLLGGGGGASAFAAGEGAVGAAEVELLADLAAEERARLDALAGGVRGLGTARRNPPALFVLSAPRSGSTLLRVMLGGHTRLFAPPELELLSYDTMRQRESALSGRDRFWREGVERAVMQLRGSDVDAARELISSYVDASTREFYAAMQEWAGGQMLVDKTPSYALEREVLGRAEEWFEGARYIHLVRRPEAMIHSFVEAQMDQIFPRFEQPLGVRGLAEAVWALSQRNILEFLKGVDEARKHVVVFEELVSEPERVLRGVCAFLGLEYEPAMAEPYRGGAERMTDGVREGSKMLGDIKFAGRGRVEAEAGERWRRKGVGELSVETARIARMLGYALDESAEGAESSPAPRADAGRRFLTPIEAAEEEFGLTIPDVSLLSAEEVEAMLGNVMAGDGN